jgi:hypothetical protein
MYLYTPPTFVLKRNWALSTVYTPCCLLICDFRELIATIMHRELAYEEKKLLYRNLVVISSLLVQMWRQQVELPVHGLCHEDSLNTNCSVSCTPSKQTLNAESGFLSLKSQDPLNWPIKHWQLYARPRQLNWYHSRSPSFVAVLYLQMNYKIWLFFRGRGGRGQRAERRHGSTTLPFGLIGFKSDTSVVGLV